jgi:hypothetical protein
MDYINGCVSGVLYASIGYPFDTLKVRLQTMHLSTSYGSYIHNPLMYQLKNIYFKESIGSLYKGFMVTGIYIPIGYGMVFGTYNTMCSYEYNGIIAATCAGAAYSLVSCPAETIKIRSQTNITINQSVWTEIVHNIKYNDMSVRALYKGLSTTLPRDVIATNVQFNSYTYIKNELSPQYGLYQASVIGGAISGGIYWIPSYPLDIIKTNVQKYRITPREACFRLMQVKGYRGLWRGFIPCITRSIIVDSLGFPMFEYMHNLTK